EIQSLLAKTQLVRPSKLPDLGLSALGLGPSRLALQVHHSHRPTACEIPGTAPLATVLAKTAGDVRGDAGVEGAIIGLDHVDPPAHCPWGSPALSSPLHRRQRYKARP